MSPPPWKKVQVAAKRCLGPIPTVPICSGGPGRRCVMPERLLKHSYSVPLDGVVRSFSIFFTNFFSLKIYTYYVSIYFITTKPEIY